MAKVEIRNATRTKIPETRLNRFARRAMNLIPEIEKEQIDITFVGEKRMRAVNAQYRGKDAVTDVLSFRLEPDPGPEPGPFGTVIICPRYAADAAREIGVPLAGHLEELILHAMLHITGSDHHTNADHKAMQRRRNRILAKIRNA